MSWRFAEGSDHCVCIGRFRDDHPTRDHLLVDLTLIVLMARLLGAVARRLGQPAVIGEVLARIVAGPLLSAAVTDLIGLHLIFGAFMFGVMMPRSSIRGGVIDQMHDRVNRRHVSRPRLPRPADHGPCGSRTDGGPVAVREFVIVEFADVIRRRRMVRQFEDRPLTPQTVERILASALRSPSAGFAQGTEFLVLTSAEDRARFWPFVPHQVNYTPRTANAPLVVVPLAHKATYLARYAQPDKGWPAGAEHRWPAPYWYIDGGMATMLLLLSAVDEGLGGFLFWLMPTGDEDDAVPAHIAAFRTEFGIPAEFEPLGAIAIGYRAVDLPPQNQHVTARRRDPSEVFHRGQFGRH